MNFFLIRLFLTKNVVFIEQPITYEVNQVWTIMPKCRNCDDDFIVDATSFCSDDCSYMHTKKYFLH